MMVCISDMPTHIITIRLVTRRVTARPIPSWLIMTIGINTIVSDLHLTYLVVFIIASSRQSSSMSRCMGSRNDLHILFHKRCRHPFGSRSPILSRPGHYCSPLLSIVSTSAISYDSPFQLKLKSSQWVRILWKCWTSMHYDSLDRR